VSAQTSTPSDSSVASDLHWFRSTEQALMDAIAVGDKTVWDRVMDDDCIVTTEEGDVLPKKKFLEELTGLPPGLSGSIKIVDLTVQDFRDFAIVRFRLEEYENIFGQEMTNQYRVTDTFRRVDGACVRRKKRLSAGRT
jgi:hypothetical protein